MVGTVPISALANVLCLFLSDARNKNTDTYSIPRVCGEEIQTHAEIMSHLYYLGI